MNIKINKEKHNYKYGCGDSCWYGITISIEYESGMPSYTVLRQDDFNEVDSVYMNIFKLNDEEFLKNNNIEYLVKDDNIIPIGMFDFQKIDKKV